MTVTDLPLRAQPWNHHALCSPATAELFFPEHGETKESRAAVRICGNCPVAAECRAWALENREYHGVWGGLSQRQLRRRVRNATATTWSPLCGTTHGADRHYHLREPACQPCLDARRDASQARRRAKRRHA